MPNRKTDKERLERDDEDEKVQKDDDGSTDRRDLDKTDTKCGSCLKTVTDQDDGVLCELCGNWFHCRCQGIAERMYKALKQYKTELHWFCKGCQAGAEKLLAVMTKMQSKIEKLEEELVRYKTDTRAEMASTINNLRDDLRNDLQQMDARLVQCESKTRECRQELNGPVTAKLTDMEKKMSTGEPMWSDIVSKEVSKEVNSVISVVTADMASLQNQTKFMLNDKEERDEIGRRKNCAVIHGVKEPSAANFESAKKEDSDNISELLHELKCDHISVSSFTRLGKKPDGMEADNKSRPIKLILASESQKDEVLTKSKNLRNTSNTKFKGVFIHQDLTPRQRERRHVLVTELKERQAKGETNLILANWKIVERRARPEAEY